MRGPAVPAPGGPLVDARGSTAPPGGGLAHVPVRAVPLQPGVRGAQPQGSAQGPEEIPGPVGCWDRDSTPKTPARGALETVDSEGRDPGPLALGSERLPQTEAWRAQAFAGFGLEAGAASSLRHALPEAGYRGEKGQPQARGQEPGAFILKARSDRPNPTPHTQDACA